MVEEQVEAACMQSDIQQYGRVGRRLKRIKMSLYTYLDLEKIEFIKWRPSRY